MGADHTDFAVPDELLTRLANTEMVVYTRRFRDRSGEERLEIIAERGRGLARCVLLASDLMKAASTPGGLRNRLVGELQGLLHYLKEHEEH